MSTELASRVSRPWFSNYDERFELEVRCAVCDQWSAVSAPWRDLQPGCAGMTLAGSAARSPFVITRHLATACSCGAPLLLVLSGAAGGRHGEEQYGVAGLRSGGRQFT